MINFLQVLSETHPLFTVGKILRQCNSASTSYHTPMGREKTLIDILREWKEIEIRFTASSTRCDGACMVLYF